MILACLDEAVRAGAREARACDVLGLDVRTVQRWRQLDVGDDRRQGPHQRPANALSDQERAEVLAMANRPEHRDLSPKQLVPKLADEGLYLASESTFYRVLHRAQQMTPRGRAKPPQPRLAPHHVATAPNQIWVWDITYLPTRVRGQFFYLYLMLDLFSRKIVGWQVHLTESMALSSQLLHQTVVKEGADSRKLTLHADNGGPMKGSTMLAKMQQLGIVPSFSRPRVSDDNAYAEAFFRHLKYAPSWPTKPFATVEQARAWVATFVAWYNDQHRHSGIRFVTPAQRHEGKEASVLAEREAVYAKAKARHPERWRGRMRDWSPVGEVALVRLGKHTDGRRRPRAATANP